MNFLKDFFKFTAFIFKMIFKLFKLVLVMTGVITLVRCSSGFSKKGDKVYYNGEEVGKDFVVLNDEFAKNDSAAYYKMKSIPDADILTFEALDNHYAKDKNKVYYCSEEREVKNFYMTKRQGVYNVVGADAPTFKLLGEDNFGYCKDKYRGYINGKSFEVKDVASLELIDHVFLKDKYQVYCNRVAVPGSDPATFKDIAEYYFKDKNNVYTYRNDGDLVILPCKKESFSVIEYPYSKDAEGVYHEDKKITGANVTSFIKLENEYAKDKNAAYFKNLKIEGADVLSFVVDKGYENTTDESYFAKDKNLVYNRNLPLKDVDVISFQALKQGYTKDKSHVYYNQKVVKGADPLTFECFGLQVGGADSKDKNHQYLEGKRAEEE